ncbi:NACHT domain-containing NTPase [Nocardia sp. NRRL S-836]|uniref:NACHT domain-containing protein n=1 Tax=Nocardia sp. NRRL S-836 TaxID=1519492 RepID=UPI0006AF9D25|nr:NACHT domain-containing protein [Nocardia sp. NRRL S-836]KOV81747.1 hypothetical protein ADL03_27455 [Nocardia sp. NRRL S-836]
MAHEDLHFTTGDVHGRVLQVGDLHGDVYLTAPPPPAPPCASPADWASTTELPAVVQDLLWAQEECAGLLPYQLPGARTPSLGTVYVRQDLGSGVEDAQPEQRPGPMLDEHGQLVDMPPAPVVRVAVRPPSKPMRAALDTDDHLVITGGPGQGKSTLTLRLTADIVRQWASASSDDAPLAEPVVPLRVPARVLAEHLGPSFSQALADSAAAEYGHLLAGPLDPGLLAGRVAGCRWLLLVDALDEVADPHTRAKIVHTLSAWAKKSTYRVLLTTRPTEGGALAALQRVASRYELQPFDEDALRLFATHWFEEEGEDCARRFLQQVREAHLFELVEVPLLATIAAIVFEQHAQDPLPGNQFELYETYLAHIRKPGSTPADFERHRVPLVEHLGRTRLETDTSLVAAVTTWAQQHPEAGPADSLIAHLKACGLFVQRGRELAFLHHSFAEHVAATAKARELPREFDSRHPAFADLLHQAQPLETGRFARAVLLHHTRLHPAEADRVLRWLHDGKAEQHLLAARLLAQHLPASPQLVNEFLAVVRGWAMTTEYPARSIVRQASRATHQPGLSDWLAELVQDDMAPFESRAEAATALVVRLRDGHMTEALALLRSAVDDQSAAVQHRLFAAEALAHGEPEQREVAERGLRSVLVDPFASGRDCRTAAVVLAAFGGGARAFAVNELERIVSDVDTPDQDLADAATALVEIDAEFHTRCAGIFLTIVRDRVLSMNGRREAVLGLAALGQQELAAEAITEVACDRRRTGGQQVRATGMLALLGQRMRAAAGDMLVARLNAFDVVSVSREVYVTPLVQLGHRDLAIDRVRHLLAEPSTSWLDVVLMATALAELGPAFHDEAATCFDRVLRHCQKTRFEYISALRGMADLVEPHRSRAIALLRAALTDLSLVPDVRCDVASELIRCAPQFHVIAVEQLMVIASSERDPDVRAVAWAQLHRLGPAMAERALREHLALARDHGTSMMLGPVFVSARAADRRVAADLLTALLMDGQRSLATRLTAAQRLVMLGKAFHRAALAGVIDLLRSGLVKNPLLLAQYFTPTGRGIRTDLAVVLGELLTRQGLGPQDRWCVIKAIDVLGHQVPLPVVHELAVDESADLDVRAEAAVMVAREDPRWLDAATDVVLAASRVLFFPTWMRLVGHLAQLGVDVHARLREVVTSPDSGRNASAEAAFLVDPESLRACSEDQYSSFDFRRYAHWLRAMRGDRCSVDYLTSALDDPDQPIADRCSAVAELAHLDNTFLDQATETVWRFAESRHLLVEERVDAAKALARLIPQEAHGLGNLITALVHHPERSDEAAASLVDYLSTTERAVVERQLLADQSIAVRHRLPKADSWGDLRLRAEVEAAVREVLDAPEYGDGDRRDALMALAECSFAQAVEVSAVLLADGSLAALKKAAKLGEWQEVHDRLRRAVVDESRPMRERRAAALVIGDLAHKPSVRDFLLHDFGSSWRDRVRELRHVGGFDELRAIRDDSALPPHFRRSAAELLFYRSIDDRVTCANVLASIAADVTVRPRLRLWSANNLSELGARGRAEALPLVSAMAHDGRLPPSVRADVADAIGKRWPTKRDDMLELLRELLPLAKPLQRTQVLYRIGAIRAWEGADGLNAMAANQELGPVVRLWAAIAMFELRRDMKERAAVVAREIAFDERVPAHVRRRAAQKLARWSEVCREEARELLRTLRLPC